MHRFFTMLLGSTSITRLNFVIRERISLHKFNLKLPYIWINFLFGHECRVSFCCLKELFCLLSYSILESNMIKTYWTNVIIQFYSNANQNPLGDKNTSTVRLIVEDVPRNGSSDRQASPELTALNLAILKVNPFQSSHETKQQSELQKLFRRCGFLMLRSGTSSLLKPIISSQR